MTGLVGIYGASGFGREVISVVRGGLKSKAADVVFIDDGPQTNRPNQQLDVLSWEAFLAQPAETKAVVIAIADSRIREILYVRCTGAGIPMHDVTAVSAVIGDNVLLGEGAILQPFVTLTADVKIGRCFHANIYSYVAHDCILGDFVTFAPGVMCNGNVSIGDRAYIGTGAIVKQGTADKRLVVGAGAVVGMGAVVTKDVPAGVTVVGNPARILEKK